MSLTRAKLYVHYQRELKQYAGPGDTYKDINYLEWYKTTKNSTRSTIIDIFLDPIEKTKLIGFIFVWDEQFIDAVYIKPEYRHQQRIFKALCKFIADNKETTKYSLIILNKNTKAKKFWENFCKYQNTNLWGMNTADESENENNKLYYFTIGESIAEQQTTEQVTEKPIEWILEREAVVKTLDIEKLKEFFIKWTKRGIYKPMKMPPDELLEVVIRYAAFNTRTIDKKIRLEAAIWLAEHGYPPEVG